MQLKTHLLLASAGLALAYPITSLTQPAPRGATDGPLPVGTILLERTDVPVTTTLSGVAVAVESAQIRPMVQGIVQEILYQPDQQMKVGDPMFQIDPTSYEAAVASAEATLQSAEAARDEAQSNAERYSSLAGGSVVTKADAQSARTALSQAAAAVKVAAANLRIARFNFANTTIVSPIGGEASNAQVSVGDLVTSGQADALATVTRLDPIHADLADTSAHMLYLRKMLDTGMARRGDAITVSLVLEDGFKLHGDGKVVSVGEQVSTSTGTFKVRIAVPNPRHLVLPGMFVTAKLTFGSYDATLVPQVAAAPQADGRLAIYVVEDGKAVQQFVTPAGSTDSNWIVAEGVDNGTQLIVDNRDKLRDGIDVTPIPSEVGSGGIVTEIGTEPAPTPESTKAEQ